MNTDRSLAEIAFLPICRFWNNGSPKGTERQINPSSKKPRNAAELERLRIEVAASLVAAAFLLANRPTRSAA